MEMYGLTGAEDDDPDVGEAAVGDAGVRRLPPLHGAARATTGLNGPRMIHLLLLLQQRRRHRRYTEIEKIEWCVLQPREVDLPKRKKRQGR
ncbi:hypothetical protein BRADI_4g26369v3 [Brachypodium distachyon]|uniref:Uncharacterized protein n=1 Tax=Brachypodium distachyon TaxID=15368 RepID=A0A0Q3EPV4_BRADI|nr:hypothetical protein BRADI_4g26369v3 [Brachypodium distachyon]